MVHKLLKSLLVLALVIALLLPGAGTAFAEPPVSSSPEQPLAYSDQWIDIQPGDYQWYAFKYHFDDSDDTANQPAQIRLYTRPSDGITLELINGEQVRVWQHGEKLRSFGAATAVQDTVKVEQSIDDFCDSTPNDPICDDNNGSIALTKCVNKRDPANTDDDCIYSYEQSRGYAMWAGSMGASGLYYILVRRPANANGAAQYRFTINGDGLTMK